MTSPMPGRSLSLSALVAAGLLLASLQSAAQQTPRILSYQGVLADAQRVAVNDGTYTMTFRIYSAATGGTALWEETGAVMTVGGVFETILGTTAPLTLDFDRPYWLATQLQGEPEMTPRVQLVATPYAMRAHSAENALRLDAAAPNVVHTLNALDGNLVLVGEGAASVRINGDTLAVVVPSTLPNGERDGQTVRWNGTTGRWEVVDPSLATTARLIGTGAAGAPLDIAQQGASDGQALVWNGATGAWAPGAAQVQTTAPLRGTGTASSPIGLENGSADRQVLTWDATNGRWSAGSVGATDEIEGNGTTAAPLQLAQQGATAGQVLRWDSVAGGWRPGPPLNLASPPLAGTGTASNPLRFTNGTTVGQMLYWDGTIWKVTAARTPQEGEVLRWNSASGVWEPAGPTVTSAVPLSTGSLWYGNAAGRAAELTVGTPGQLLAVRPDGAGPQWTSNLTVDSISAATIRTAGNAIVEGGLTVSGSPVTLPNGSIDNNELANPSITLAYGSGVEGDASATLGGTLNLRNTGVLTVNGTPNRVSVDTVRGNVTLTLPQDIHTDARPTFDGITLDNLTNGSTSDTLLVSLGGLVQSRTVASIASGLSTNVAYGAGINGDAVIAPGGTLNVRNTGVLTVNGTANRISVDTVRGDVTLTLPQDIHTNARPTFDGITLDNLTNGSTSDTLLVSLGGVVQSRTVASLTALFSSDVWTTTGNSGTTPGTNFVGTNDNQPLELRVDNANATATNGRGRVMRFEPNATSPTIIGGFNGNSVAAGTTGATISGGGQAGSINSISSNTATIAGGSGNQIATAAATSVISGGASNRINASASTSVIAGGSGNTINSTTSVISGGDNATIGTNARWSVILGGHNNVINDNAFESTIGAGEGNTVGTNSVRGTIGGGSFNAIGTNSSNSTISAGYGNTIRASADRSTIGGGMSNLINQGASISTVAGGFQNTVDTSATSSSIGGGTNNKIGTSSSNSVIGGGSDNNIAVSSARANIGGGNRNYIAATGSVIAGGENDSISTSAAQSTIGGGNLNRIGQGSSQATISGGTTNIIGSSASGAAISGGSTNSVGNSARFSTIAGGRGLTLDGRGSFGFLGNNDAGSRNMGVSATDVTVFGNTDLWLANNDNAASQLRFYEANSSTGAFPGTTNYSSFQAQAQAADINYVLPDTAGIVGDLLSVKAVSGTTVTLDWATVGGGNTDWSITGNSSTTPGTNFLGTVDDVAFQIHVGNGTATGTDGRGRVMRFEPNATSANIIGGFSSNSVAGSIVGATISGGGANGSANTIASNYGTVGGGRSNTIGASSINATIAGGASNQVTSSANNATVSGGLGNVIASGDYATISGGEANTVSGSRSTIAGGRGMTLSGTGSFGFLGANTGSNDMSVNTNNVAVLGNTDLWLANNRNAASQLRFYEANSSTGAFPGTTNYSSFQAQAQAADINYVLPDTAGIAGDVLSVKAVSGTTVTLDWAAAAAGGGSTDWSITGNSSTTPGTNFLGTVDDVAFQIHVGNGSATGTNGRGRVMRFEPNATSANIIGGFSSNSVSAGVTAATISGGGANGNANTIASNTSTISGGSGNSIGASSINATIAGGRSNQVGASAGNGTVSGGLGNVIVSGDHATISGGFNNRINTGAFGSKIGGGTNNAISSHTSVLGGGNANAVGTSSQFSTIGGGNQNLIGNSAFESVIAGGTTDTIEAGATYSTIGGGTSNAIRSTATRSVIAGGYNNEITSGADRSTISGGEANTVSGSRSTIAGGRGMTLSGTGSFGFLGANTGSNDMSVNTNNVAVLGNTDLWLANNRNAASQLRFYEANSSTGAFPGTTNYSSFQAQAQATDIDYLLPAAAGVAGDQLTITGVAGTQVTLGWAAPSDRRIKSDIVMLNGEDILTRFRGLPLGSWRYTSDLSGRRHYGIMAQDFKRLFGKDGVGSIGTDTTVNDLDLIGVSYLAIQGLEQRTVESRGAIDELKEMVLEMRRELEALREENRRLREGVR